MALPLLLWWHRYPPGSGKLLEAAPLGQKKSLLINQGPYFLVRLELVIPRVTLSEGRLRCPELVLIRDGTRLGGLPAAVPAGVKVTPSSACGRH